MTKRDGGPRTANALLLVVALPLGGCVYDTVSPAEATAGVDAADAALSNAHAVSGTLRGLNGSGLVLQNNGIDDIGVGADGTFRFPAALESGSAYDVTVSLQPTAPLEKCVVANGSGVVGQSDIGDVTVTCTLAVFAVGGHVDGLAALGLILASGSEEITLAHDGDFVFFHTIALGAAYAVTVAQQPEGSTCAVVDGRGTMGTGHELEIAVKCSANSLSGSRGAPLPLELPSALRWRRASNAGDGSN